MASERGNSSPSTKLKQKKSIGKLLLPNKVPNRVGIALSRSPSRKDAVTLDQVDSPRNLAVYRRPLSLDLSNLTPKKEEEFIFPPTDEYVLPSPKQNEKVSALHVNRVRFA